MKKFLSLVLALVMTMSLVTVSAGAKDFTDDSKIDYKEAVDVMSAAGIIDGYTDGSFNPQGTLSRGAAAKIICNMILGPTTAAALSADTAPYSDVPVNHTFAGYIAYCSSQGIISGYADGTFRPAGTLTGYAFMKMLLGALGYDAQIEGYVGNNWSIQVAKRALNIGLDDDLIDNFVGTKAVNREEACLYAFNTLKATMVDYDSKTTVNVSGAEITIGNSNAYELRNNTKTDGRIKGDGLMQFAEKYFSKLVCESATTDLKKPATKWTYDGEKVGTYAKTADATVVLADAKTVKVVLTDSDFMNYDEEDVLASADVYANGLLVDNYADLTSIKLGVGDTVEAFENDNHDVYRVVVTRYQAAKVDSVEDDLNSTYVKKGAAYGVTLDKVDDCANDIPGRTYYDAYNNDSSKVIPGFDADTYKEGTVLAVALKAGSKEYTGDKKDVLTLTKDSGEQILATYVAGSVEGKIDVYNTAYAYMDSVKYKKTAAYDGVNYNSYDADSEYIIYTTAEGHALAISGKSSAITDVWYVLGTFGDASYGSNNITHYAQAVNIASGEVKEFKMEAKQAGVTLDKEGKWQPVGGLYTFEDKTVYNEKTPSVKDCKANDGKFNAVAWYGSSSYYYSIATADKQTNALASEVNKDSTSVNLVEDNTKTYEHSSTEAKTAATKKYINSETVFTSIEDVAAGLTVKTATGLMKMNVKDPSTVVVVYKKDSTKAAYVVYVGADLSSAVGAADVVYVAKNQDFDHDTANKNTFAEIYFMDDMKAEDVVLSGTRYDTESGGAFYTYTVDSNDVYSLEGYSTQAVVNGSKKTDGVDVITLDSKNDYDSDNCILSGKKLVDASYAKATVVDARTGTARDADVWTEEVTSVEQLNRMLNKADNYNGSNGGDAFEVVLEVYVEDGEITFIAVAAVNDATPASGNGPQVSTDITSVTLAANGTVTVALSADAEAGDTYTAEVYMFNAATAEYVEIGSVTATVDAGDLDAAVGSAAGMMVNGTLYKVVVDGVESQAVVAAKA